MAMSFEVLDKRRREVFQKALRVFKEPLVLNRKNEVIYKIQTTYDIDLVEYTEDMVKELLNDIIYPKTENLFTKYIIPPFSILDTRTGEWQKRKNKLDEHLGSSLAGRDGNLTYNIGGNSSVVGKVREDDNGTSQFDSLLAELLLKWFGFPNCKVYDPFAGGHIRGGLSTILGYQYLGIDLNHEQILANQRRAIELNINPTWVTDDSLNSDKYLKDDSVDLIFTCPPYGDLEKYTDDPRDLSNMDYSQFLKNYSEILRLAVNKLRDDRFISIVVGDFRDRCGFYCGLVKDTISIFQSLKIGLYNEMILLNNIGTAAFRANQNFSTRKMVKLHQNVLIFYKGDPKNIKNLYNTIDSTLPFKEKVQVGLGI